MSPPSGHETIAINPVFDVQPAGLVSALPAPAASCNVMRDRPPDVMLRALPLERRGLVHIRGREAFASAFSGEFAHGRNSRDVRAADELHLAGNRRSEILWTSQWVNDKLDLLGTALISLTGYADRLRMFTLQ
jgi:hypothetical protein